MAITLRIDTAGRLMRTRLEWDWLAEQLAVTAGEHWHELTGAEQDRWREVAVRAVELLAERELEVADEDGF